MVMLVDGGMWVATGADGVRHVIANRDCGTMPVDSCATMLWDPPWDAGVVRPHCAAESTLAFCDGGRAGDVVRDLGAPAWVFSWDCVTSWYTPNRPLRRMKLCLWYGNVHSYNPDGYRAPNDTGEQRTRTVKNTRGSYVFTPDPRGTRVSDLFVQPITCRPRIHKHAKPQGWIDSLILCCGSRGLLFDPCAGGGSALDTCIRNSIPSVHCDTDPDCVDALIRLSAAYGLTIGECEAVPEDLTRHPV